MKRLLLGTATTLLAAASMTAHGVPVMATITVDNSYALFYGTASSATNFVGADVLQVHASGGTGPNWRRADSYNFNLPDNYYLYVVTASDVFKAQGFLGQFENLDSGRKIYTQDRHWQVMGTGLGSALPYTGSAADLSLLSNEIVDANGGGNPSNGWINTTDGPSNGSAPWGSIAGIDEAAKWVWYSSNGDTDPTSPAFDHSEWQVFRIQAAQIGVATTSVIPEPRTLELLGLGLLAVAAMVRRRGTEDTDPLRWAS